MLNLNPFRAVHVPFVAAAELNECGLACLAACSQYFEGEYGLSEIRQLTMHSGRGETFLELRNIAERIGLVARGLKLEVEGLAQLSVPAILHWDMNHFVVLEGIGRAGIHVMDPAAGRIHVRWADLRKSFTGVALEVRVSAEWRRRTQPRRSPSLMRYLAPLSQWRWDILLVLALSLLLELTVLTMPLQMRLAIDNVTLGSESRLVWILAVCFGAVSLVQAAISTIRGWAAAVLTARIGYELKDRFVTALHRKPARFFLRYHSADILSRSRSVDTIQSLLTAQLLQALLDTVLSVLLLIAMFVVASFMAWVVLFFAAVNIAITGTLTRSALEISRRSLRVAAKADSFFLENARAARAIKLFGKESVRSAIWRNKFIELTNITLADGRLLIFSNQAALLTSTLGNVALIAIGTDLVIGNQITLGTMVVVFLFRAFLVERLNRATSYVMELRRVRTNAERIADVMAPDDDDSVDSRHPPFVPLGDAALGIALKDVWFRYGADTPWVLEGVNLTVAPGESIAITGASGSGKTTMLNLMLGLLKPTRGEVLVDGRDLSTIASGDYGRVIGVVMQDDIMFQGTVAENIAFFDTPLDMEKIQLAAERADIASDIAALPMKFYSLLAEAGSDISGGQKQRLFIARALYHLPRILFLDEATSHLDSASEHRVSQAVQKMDITRVLVAHRRETISTAGRVVSLDPKTHTLRGGSETIA